MKKPVDSPSQLSPSPPPSPPFSPQDFEFSISLSPSSAKSSTLCPADELFYKGQLLPLNLPPRFQMVRTILARSNSSKVEEISDFVDLDASIDLLYSTLWSKDSSSDTTTSRDSNGSSNDSSCFSTAADTPDCDSSRPSSATEDERTRTHFSSLRKLKHFSFSPLKNRFTSVFRSKNTDPSMVDKERSSKKMSKSAKEVFQKYLKKVKPLYEKISQKHEQQQQQEQRKFPIVRGSFLTKAEKSVGQSCRGYSHSFSGNLHYPMNGRKNRGFNGFPTTASSSTIGSCPSSMRSSPSHSGILYGYTNSTSKDSTMEELQNAIQGAIAHCKNSIKQSQGEGEMNTETAGPYFNFSRF